jgi:hypothetical protein
MIELILQPPGSSLCGQACVAMAVGISLEESVKVFGHRHTTRTKEVARVLNALGIQCPSRRLKRLTDRTQWPTRAIIKEIYGPIRKRKSYWVLLWDGHIYDPDPHDVLGSMYSSYLGIGKTAEVSK